MNNNAADDTTTIVAGTNGSLTVNKSGAGSGTVTSADGGINCGGTCGRVVYVDTSNITLTAVPNAGDVFTGWSGACSGTAPICIATINGATTTTATFVHASLDVDASSPATKYGVLTDGMLVLRWMLADQWCDCARGWSQCERDRGAFSSQASGHGITVVCVLVPHRSPRLNVSDNGLPARLHVDMMHGHRLVAAVA